MGLILFMRTVLQSDRKDAMFVPIFETNYGITDVYRSYMGKQVNKASAKI